MKALNLRETKWSRRTTDLLVQRQALFDLFRCCKSLILLRWSGRVDLNHRPPGPEPIDSKILSRRQTRWGRRMPGGSHEESI